MRQLKYHEKRLLKKVNLYEWKNRGGGSREARVLERYKISDRDEYHKYNKLTGLVTKLVSQLRTLPSDDEARLAITETLCAKLNEIGVTVNCQGLSSLENLAASAFCRRRLAVVLTRLKFCPDIEHAISMIEGGHIRIGPRVIIDPAFHVTKSQEDQISWTAGSSMLRKIQEFRDETDDFDLSAL